MSQGEESAPVHADLAAVPGIVLQLVAATSNQINSGVPIPAPYVGYSDRDDAWIRQWWASTRSDNLRQEVWRIEYFLQIAQAHNVAVVFRNDLPGGSLHPGSTQTIADPAHPHQHADGVYV